VSYGYSNVGNRASVTYPGGSNQVTYGYDAANDLTIVTDWNSNQTSYAYDNSGRLASGTLPNGVVTTYSYDVFGGIRSSTGSQANSFTFTGEQTDSGTGFEYLRSRYYDPAIGRFLSKDGLTGTLRAPQGLNRYVYGLNNPVRLVDPLGTTATKSASIIAKANAICDLFAFDCDHMTREMAEDVLIQNPCIVEVCPDYTFEPVLEAGGLRLPGGGRTPRRASLPGGLHPAKMVPVGMNLKKFGAALWGETPAATRAKIPSLTREGLEKTGVTREIADYWHAVYQRAVHPPAGENPRGGENAVARAT